MNSDDIDNLLRPIRKALEAVYQQAFDAGREAAVREVIANVSAIVPGSSDQPLPGIFAASGSVASAGEAQAVGVRAPRGLAEQVIDEELRKRPGMTMDQVEDAVVAADPRIARKSIYNTLRRYEKEGKRFRRINGVHWYRVADIPAPWAQSSSPNEDEAAESPISDNSAASGPTSHSADEDGREVAHDNMTS